MLWLLNIVCLLFYVPTTYVSVLRLSSIIISQHVWVHNDHVDKLHQIHMSVAELSTIIRSQHAWFRNHHVDKLDHIYRSVLKLFTLTLPQQVQLRSYHVNKIHQIHVSVLKLYTRIPLQHVQHCLIIATNQPEYLTWLQISPFTECRRRTSRWTIVTQHGTSIMKTTSRTWSSTTTNTCGSATTRPSTASGRTISLYLPSRTIVSVRENNQYFSSGVYSGYYF